jgi:hypothetical protein
METVRETLGDALKNHMTNVVVKAAKPDGDTMVYFDDFLGDGDISPENKTEVSEPNNTVWQSSFDLMLLVDSFSITPELVL